jgi:hypothetical protein
LKPHVARLGELGESSFADDAREPFEHGKNGFLVDNEDEMAAIVDKAGELDPEDCRRSAERFSPDRVAARYEAVFHDAMDTGGGTRRRVAATTEAASR